MVIFQKIKIVYKKWTVRRWMRWKFDTNRRISFFHCCNFFFFWADESKSWRTSIQIWAEHILAHFHCYLLSNYLTCFQTITSIRILFLLLLFLLFLSYHYPHPLTKVKDEIEMKKKMNKRLKSFFSFFVFFRFFSIFKSFGFFLGILGYFYYVGFLWSMPS